LLSLRPLGDWRGVAIFPAENPREKAFEPVAAFSVSGNSFFQGRNANPKAALRALIRERLRPLARVSALWGRFHRQFPLWVGGHFPAAFCRRKMRTRLRENSIFQATKNPACTNSPRAP
jgi:hypothetical protein